MLTWTCRQNVLQSSQGNYGVSILQYMQDILHYIFWPANKNLKTTDIHDKKKKWTLCARLQWLIILKKEKQILKFYSSSDFLHREINLLCVIPCLQIYIYLYGIFTFSTSQPMLADIWEGVFILKWGGWSKFGTGQLQWSIFIDIKYMVPAGHQPCSWLCTHDYAHMIMHTYVLHIPQIYNL
jgi:hypothetical protein